MSAGLLLHVCCAPCAAYSVPALRALAPRLTGFFFNPNIQPVEEQTRRLDALERFAPRLGLDLVIAAGGDGAESRESDEERLDALNEEILHEVRARGRCITSSTRVGGRFAIRPCYVNPRSGLADADALVDEVLAVGRSLSS
jgi:hypothetical protein